MRMGALGLLMVALAGACSDQEGPSRTPVSGQAGDGVLSVYVVNYPLKYFAERIGGPTVDVRLPVPADVDPAFWEPATEQVVTFQQADLILLNGAAYAKWVQRVSLPETRVVDTSAAFADRYIPLPDQTTHSHGATGEHRHGDLAFTTWLDPQQAIGQAAAIRDALARLRPQLADRFQRGFAALEADLQALDSALLEAFARWEGQRVVFSHPVYQYLIRRYGIDGRELHWEPDSMPADREWDALGRLLEKSPAQQMIWEGPPQPPIVKSLEQHGLRSLVFEPGANQPVQGDYLDLMQRNLRRLNGSP